MSDNYTAIHAENSAEVVSITEARAWTSVAGRCIVNIVEPCAALLLTAEIFILGAGVFSRYVLRNPLPWTDDLSTFVFLWLAMLGAVAAYQRDQHMRLDVLLRNASPRTQAVLASVSSAIVAVLCILLLPACRQLYVIEQVDISPALGFPRSYEIAAVIVGLGLIGVLAVLRLIAAERRIALWVALAAVAVCVASTFAHPFLAQLGNVNLILFFVIVVGACVLIGVPIAFAFGFGTLAYLALTTTTPLSTMIGRIDAGISNLVLLAIPLFVLLGVLLEGAGIARRIVDFLASLVGHVRGGLDIVLVLAMYLVSGISGSKTADMAAVAPALFPAMERRGQQRHEMIALLATSAAMAETIPPSLVLIIIGTVVGVSIRDLFTAGLLPAAVMAVALVIVSLIRARYNDTGAARPSAGAIARAFVAAVPGLLLPLVIRFFVVTGIATATEVSTVGIVYSLGVGTLVYRDFRWSQAYPMLQATVRLAGAILLIIAMATAMSWALTQSGFAQQLATVLAHAGGAAGFMALSIVLFAVLGSVLEGIPAVVLFAPLLFPIAHTLGIRDVHYAVVVVLSMGLGLFSPPLGIGYYAACAIGRVEPHLAMKPIVAYLAALVIALALIAAIPWLSVGFLGS